MFDLWASLRLLSLDIYVGLVATIQTSNPPAHTWRGQYERLTRLRHPASAQSNFNHLRGLRPSLLQLQLLGLSQVSPHLEDGSGRETNVEIWLDISSRILATNNQTSKSHGRDNANGRNPLMVWWWWPTHRAMFNLSTRSRQLNPPWGLLQPKPAFALCLKRLSMTTSALRATTVVLTLVSFNKRSSTPWASSTSRPGVTVTVTSTSGSTGPTLTSQWPTTSTSTRPTTWTLPVNTFQSWSHYGRVSFAVIDQKQINNSPLSPTPPLVLEREMVCPISTYWGVNQLYSC